MVRAPSFQQPVSRIMTPPATALPVEAPHAFLGVARSLTDKLWRDRLDARGAAKALAIVQRHQLPELLARVLVGRGVGQQVETIARELETQLTKRTGDLVASIERMSHRSRGERMVDLSLNAIELIDRNLYERTCDVRWWATDSAVVDCAASPSAAAVSHVSQRLGVILGAYTVYLDLWLCDLDGNVIASGRADRFGVVGQNVAHTKWFREAKDLRSGDDYVAGDVENQPLLGNAQVATYCASVRAGGQANGAPSGVLAIHFDWEAQARAIVQGVRVGDNDKARVLLVDSNFRVIAASDGQGILSERISLSLNGQRSGFYQDRSGTLVAFHATPGYETYRGLGWYGGIVCGA